MGDIYRAVECETQFRKPWNQYWVKETIWVLSATHDEAIEIARDHFESHGWDSRNLKVKRVVEALR